MKIGTLIKTIRTSRGISQKAFAKQLDISTNYLCLIETENRSPSNSLIGKVASNFEISKEALEFVCTPIPEEFDEVNTQKFKDLQENIAALLLFRSNNAA